MNQIIKKSYDKVDYIVENPNIRRKPLMIGCSGGGGHISAIKGIEGYFNQQFNGEIDFPQYTPLHYANRQKSNTRDQIKAGIEIMYAPVVGKPVREMLELTPFPILPEGKKLETEISKLLSGSPRKYIDMLLDVFPAGFESAAIWNVLQREDKVSDLKKLIHLQHVSDQENYQTVHNYYFNLLKSAAEAGQPYSEVISTQAMALPALCDAVKDYNNWVKEQQLADTPKVYIHQYLTDLPTQGAVHFFNGLAKLASEQQAQMKLYGVGMSEEVINNFFHKANNFAGLFDIPAKGNPMVRPAFSDPELDYSNKFREDVTLKFKSTSRDTMDEYQIAADEQIATIMLGSQGGNDTYEYIETLIKNGISKIVVFGVHSNKELKNRIADLIEQHPEYASRIISLGNQDDKQIAPLMSRSNIVVIRGGGLSVMEQLAMNHNPEQTVFIHHADSDNEELTSGISWEDDNVKNLIHELSAVGVYCEKTSPNRAERQVAEARLIAAVKRVVPGIYMEDAIQHIKMLSAEGLAYFVSQLQNSEQAIEQLVEYFIDRELDAQKHIDLLNAQLDEGLNYLENVISEELNKLDTFDGISQYFRVQNQIMQINSFDATKVAADYDRNIFKDASSAFHTAVATCRVIIQLKSHINPKSRSFSSRKLANFKEEYEKTEIKSQLSKAPGIVRQVIDFINNILSAYFPDLGVKPTFYQQIEESMNNLKNKENEQMSLERYSFFHKAQIKVSGKKEVEEDVKDISKKLSGNG